MVRIPTSELVELSRAKFTKENVTDEQALTELFRVFPKNTDASHVLLKVTAVNSIYSTNIFAFKMLASQIHAVGVRLDEEIEIGSLNAFELIEYFILEGKTRRSCFSFASKYLSWQ